MTPAERAALLDALEAADDRLSRRERAALARMRAAGDRLYDLASGAGARTKKERVEWRAASGVLDSNDFGRRGL